MKIRVKELAEAMNIDYSELLSICALLKIPASTRISSLTIEQAKKITDFYSDKSS